MTSYLVSVRSTVECECAKCMVMFVQGVLSMVGCSFQTPFYMLILRSLQFHDVLMCV